MQLAPLADFVEYQNDPIMIDDEQTYARVTTKIHRKGVVLRDVVRGSEIKTKKQQICRAYQLLVAEIDAKVGGYGMVPKELEGAIVSSHYFLFNVKEKELLSNYLSYVLKTDGFFSQIKAQGSTNYASIRPKDILKIKIPYCEVSEQEVLVKKLDNFYGKNSLLEQGIHRERIQITDLRHSILQEAVSGKLVPQDPNEETASDLLKKINTEKDKMVNQRMSKKEQEIVPVTQHDIPYELPSNWIWVRTGELLVSFDYGTSQRSLDGIDGVPVLNMGNVLEGKLHFSNLKRLGRESKDLPRLLLRNGDILFNRTNSFELVGKAGIYEGPDDKYTFASYLIRLRILDYTNPKYVNYYFMSPTFRKTQIIPKVVQQCGQANFNGTKLRNTLVPLPPLNEQNRLVEKLDQAMKVCDELEGRLEQDLNNLNHLKESILRDVFEPLELSLFIH